MIIVTVFVLIFFVWSSSTAVQFQWKIINHQCHQWNGKISMNYSFKTSSPTQLFTLIIQVAKQPTFKPFNLIFESHRPNNKDPSPAVTSNSQYQHQHTLGTTSYEKSLSPPLFSLALSRIVICILETDQFSFYGYVFGRSSWSLPSSADIW